MLKKAKAGHGRRAKRAARAGKDAAQPVLDSSRHIWLAGLGAFSRAQAEGMKCSRRCEAGRGARTQDAAGGVGHGGGGARRRKAKVKEMQQMASAAPGTSSSRCSRSAWRARCRSSASTRKTTSQRLTERVDALSDAVNELIKAHGRAAAGRARRQARRSKPPAKKASAQQARRPKAAQGARRRASAKSPRRADARARGMAGSRVAARRTRAASLPVQLVDLLDVVRHRLVRGHALELRPGVVLGAADEIEAARALARRRRPRSPACSTSRA